MKDKNKFKETIIKTALKLMADKGIEAVSMREIAEELKVTKPVIYYYFKDKEDLIKQAIFNKAKELDLEFEANIGKKTLLLEELIDFIVERHYVFMRDNPYAVKIFMKIMDAPSSSPIKKCALDMRNRNKKKINKLLSAMVERKQISRDMALCAMHMISAIFSYIVLESRIAKEEITLNIVKKMAKVAAVGIKNMKIVFFAALFPIFAIKAPCETLTVEEAVKIALEKNVSVENARENKEIYEKKIKEYYGSVYPNISLNASYTRNIEKQSMFFGGNKIEIGLDNAYSLSLDLNQILWAGGKVDTGVKMAKIYKEVAEKNLKMTELSVKKNIKQLYYGAALMLQMADIQKEVLSISQKYLETIKEKYSKGLESDLAVLRQDVEVSNNKPALIKAQNAYAQGLLAVKNILAMDSESDISLKKEFDCYFDEKSIEDLYAQAFANRTDYRLAVLNKDLAEKQLKLEKSGHWPTLSAFASRSFSGQSDSSFPSSNERAWSMTAGARFSMPIFSGFAVNARVSQAKNNLKIAKNNLEEIKRKIKLDVKGAALDLSEAKERIDSQKTSVDTARKALAAVEMRFKNGLSSQLELNDAALAFNRAEVFYAQARHDYCSFAARLDWELGR